MNNRSFWFLGFLGLPLGCLFSQTALVRHAPTLNGSVEGSIQQMIAESTTLNGGALISGNLLVPGTPAVLLNGSPVYGGTIDGTGAATPSSHKITLNGSAVLGHVVRRIDGADLPTVAAPPVPTGSLATTVSAPGQTIIWTNLRDLTLVSGAGQYSVPPGNYGDFTANAGSGFTLGVVGATQPAIYSFQQLTLKNSAQLAVVGPVIVTVASQASTSANLGSPSAPGWLQLKFSSGGLTLTGNASVYGYVLAPTGLVEIGGNSQLVGGLVADGLTINGNGLLRLVIPTTTNQPPAVALTAPQNGASYAAPASVTLQAAASDPDGSVAKVEFYQAALKLGEDTTAPFSLSLSISQPGSLTYTARAIDNLGATTDSAAITIAITNPNQPPVVVLTTPADGVLLTAPVAVSLSASASDSDGTISKVEFYQGATKLGEDLSAPYEFTSATLGAGTYSFSARAHDSQNLTADSAVATVTVVVANQSPGVALTSPASGGTFTAPANFILAATASDSDGTIVRVEFFKDAVKVGEDLTAPYELGVTGLVAGTYNFLARAVDNTGSSADSAPLTITVAPASNTLPFLANFEPAEGYQAGSLNGQKGWSVTGSASIVTSPVYGGQQAVSVAPSLPPALLVRTFSSGETRVTFVDFFTRPQAAASASSGVFIDTDVAAVALTASATSGVLQAYDGNGSGGGTWLPTGKGPALDVTGQTADWLRLTVRTDYLGKKWDLYFNGQMIAADLGFINSSATAFTGLGLSGHATATTHFDDLLVAFENPMFADDDEDGMSDAWESAHGLSPALNDRNGDLDGDGLTNLREYILGTNPNSADSDGDGLSDSQERTLGTNPNQADSDGDGLPDGWEQSRGLNPLSAADAAADLDGDGVSNLAEFNAGTDPTDYYNGTLPQITSLVAAGGELGPGDTLQLLVTDVAGQPLANAPVTFTATAGGHQLAATANGPAMAEVEVRTGPDGIARAYVRGGTN